MFGWRGRTRLASDVAARFAVGVLPLFKSDFAMSGIHSMADENVLRLYDSIREQASADIRLGSRHRLLGEAAQQQAERLREELDRRGLRYTPIVWGIVRV
jgi:hypothetical protein